MNDEIEAASKRCGEAAARMWEITTMTVLLEAIRAPAVLESIARQNPSCFHGDRLRELKTAAGVLPAAASFRQRPALLVVR
jgi:hypothetical protein